MSRTSEFVSQRNAFPATPQGGSGEPTPFIAALELKPRCRELLEILDSLLSPGESLPLPGPAA